MPELPEVNTFQRYFNQAALDQRIARVEVYDDKIIRNVSGVQFVELLSNQSFVDSYRQGKYLFGILDNAHSVLLHFGMTGDLKYYREMEEQPKHERFVFIFENGFRLGFDCPRKFAKIRYLEDHKVYIEKLGLGEDALRISQKEFLTKMRAKTGSIKGFLLNQSNLAGVGNLYADEICYQCKIHPASKVSLLNEAQRLEIFLAMKKILQFGVDRNATYGIYPKNWLWHFREEGSTGPQGKGIMGRAKVAGRTSYFVEGVQRLLI